MERVVPLFDDELAFLRDWPVCVGYDLLLREHVTWRGGLLFLCRRISDSGCLRSWHLQLGNPSPICFLDKRLIERARSLLGLNRFATIRPERVYRESVSLINGSRLLREKLGGDISTEGTLRAYRLERGFLDLDGKKLVWRAPKVHMIFGSVNLSAHSDIGSPCTNCKPTIV